MMATLKSFDGGEFGAHLALPASAVPICSGDKSRASS